MERADRDDPGDLLEYLRRAQTLHLERINMRRNARDRHDPGMQLCCGGLHHRRRTIPVFRLRRSDDRQGQDHVFRQAARWELGAGNAGGLGGTGDGKAARPDPSDLEEFESLRSHFATLNKNRGKPSDPA